eukprot:scaffold125973_cov57-Phaeocystis_antarctica.AAC.1
MAQLRVSAGLGQLEAKKYKLAARKFLETNPELGSSFHEIVSPQARTAPHLCTAQRLRTPPVACPVAPLCTRSAPALHPLCECAPRCTTFAPPCPSAALSRRTWRPTVRSARWPPSTALSSRPRSSTTPTSAPSSSSCP